MARNIGNSVTRLGDFGNILETNFLTKVAQILDGFGGVFKNSTLLLKSAEATLRTYLEENLANF